MSIRRGEESSQHDMNQPTDRSLAIGATGMSAFRSDTTNILEYTTETKDPPVTVEDADELSCLALTSLHAPETNDHENSISRNAASFLSQEDTEVYRSIDVGGLSTFEENDSPSGLWGQFLDADAPLPDYTNHNTNTKEGRALPELTAPSLQNKKQKLKEETLGPYTSTQSTPTPAIAQQHSAPFFLAETTFLFNSHQPHEAVPVLRAALESEEVVHTFVQDKLKLKCVLRGCEFVVQLFPHARGSVVEFQRRSREGAFAFNAVFRAVLTRLSRANKGSLASMAGPDSMVARALLSVGGGGGATPNPADAALGRAKPLEEEKGSVEQGEGAFVTLVGMASSKQADVQAEAFKALIGGLTDIHFRFGYMSRETNESLLAEVTSVLGSTTAGARHKELATELAGLIEERLR